MGICYRSLVMDLKKYTESILESTRESTTGLEFDLRFDIVNFIKAKLKETGDTQRSLALKMKMKDSQLTRIMNAETNITLKLWPESIMLLTLGQLYRQNLIMQMLQAWVLFLLNKQ